MAVPATMEGSNVFSSSGGSAIAYMPPSLAILVLSLPTLLRTMVAYHPHSGQDNHHGSLTAYGGDYEAQRHWMELTLHVPMGEWYTHDLGYWGLDYPPLTAYVSWVCGWFSAKLVGEESVALGTSRGYEDSVHKAFMRGTVLVLDVLVYYSAVWVLARRLSLESTGRRAWLIVMALVQPAIILIDHGHFQYNTVSLGLALWSFHFMTLGADSTNSGGYGRRPAFRHCVTGSILFSLSLNFKQMSLYYAPAVFAYLLGRCFESSPSSSSGSAKAFLGRFTALGTAVIFTFATHFVPFIIYRSPSTSPSEAVMNIIRRLFPFQRGLFEGKVSNIWCALSTRPISIRDRVPEDLFPTLALLLTMFLVLPGCVALFDVGRRGRKIVTANQRGGPTLEEEDLHLRYLLWGASASSLSFFLASFQVHEKGILMTVAPLSLLWLDRPLFISWFSIIASWTLWPLLVVDRLELAYFVMVVIFVSMTSMGGEEVASEIEQIRIGGDWSLRGLANPSSKWAVVAAADSMALALILHTAEFIVNVPASLPDLFPVLWSLAGCATFCWSWLCCSVVMFTDSEVARQRKTASQHVAGKRKDD